MSELIMLGDIVKSEDGIIGIFDSIHNEKYVIRNKEGKFEVEKIKRLTIKEMETLCKTLLKG